MAWSLPTWKILQIFQSQFLFREVRAETRHTFTQSESSAFYKELINRCKTVIEHIEQELN